MHISEARDSLTRYFPFYTGERARTYLGNRTPHVGPSGLLSGIIEKSYQP